MNSHLVSCTVGQNQQQILVTHALDVMLGSDREKYDVSNADVEVGSDSRENDPDLLQAKQQYAATTVSGALLLDKYRVLVPAPRSLS